jgi:hypothetical protein
MLEYQAVRSARELSLALYYLGRFIVSQERERICHMLLHACGPLRTILEGDEE